MTGDFLRFHVLRTVGRSFGRVRHDHQLNAGYGRSPCGPLVLTYVVL
jgi:hypothetical protein